MNVKTTILNTTRLAVLAIISAACAAAQEAQNPKNTADVLVSIMTRSKIN